MDPREIGWEVVDWIRLVQDREQWRAVVNMVMNLWEFHDELSDYWLLKKGSAPYS
jgi:hypothetical protein